MNSGFFYSQVSTGIVRSLGNNYKDNWDFARFGKKPILRLKRRIKFIASSLLHKAGLIRFNDYIEALALAKIDFSSFDYLYKLLDDHESRDLLVNVFLYRILGHRRVKLPLNTPKYWSDFKAIEGMADRTDKIDSQFLDFMLYRFNLKELGFPVSIYYNSLGILTDFVVQQYLYDRGGTRVAAEQGDVVIDGGGCWGDTALYFASCVGKSGKVFCFEFIPSNLELFDKNLSINPELREGIEVVCHPLWNTSNTRVYYKDFGPASKVGLEPFIGSTGETTTRTIDDFVNTGNLQRVDFIKLDIEGAEKNALSGAIETLRKFKPKLAIALYHYGEDFGAIPEMIEKLDLGYRFHISHCTIHQEETILFAQVEK